MSQDQAVPAPDKSSHLCMTCGFRIFPGELEVKVTLTGTYKGRIRYRHDRPDDCMAATRRRGINVARIGRYGG